MDRLRGIFGLDLRSLALCRFALGGWLIGDLINRATALEAHYSDFGVLPRATLIESYQPGQRFSLHLLSGTVEFQAALFIIAGLCALALMVGYRTRLATVASWILLASLHSRNTVILYGGDQLALMLLFWGMFVPWGARFSVDSALSKQLPRSSQIASAATVAWLFQLCFVYWFGVMVKYDKAWRTEGTALWFALNVDQLATPLGVWLRNRPPALLKVMSLGTYYWEALGPILLFFPLRWRLIRSLTVLGFVVMHTSFMLCLNVGMFSPLMILAWSSLLPASVWEWLGRRRDRRGAGWTIYFDGNCRFCGKLGRILRTMLLLEAVPFVPAQENDRIQVVLHREQSWVVTGPGGTVHTKFDAVTRLMRCSPLLWWATPLTKLPGLLWIGDRAYEWIAAHRMTLSRLTGWLRGGKPVRVRASWAGQIIAVYFLWLITMWNLVELPYKHEEDRFFTFETPVFAQVYWTAELTQTAQQWGMFAPYPLRQDGWPVAHAKLSGGREVDLIRDGADISWEKPDYIYPVVFENERWYKYRSNLWFEDTRHHIGHYMPYLCRKWNRDHKGTQRVVQLKLYYMMEYTQIDGVDPIKKEPLGSHHCP